MEEAFIYAKNQDRADEIPQYQSTPLSIGEDLTFNYIPSSVDLYIKDSEDDTGKEPNTVTQLYWISPSICIRNEMDNIFEHQNPEYSASHKTAYIYIRVYNRGKEAFDGTGKWVMAYWAEASTAITPKIWKGMEILSTGQSKGGFAGSSKIGVIPPGEYMDVVIPWRLPSIMELAPEGNSHFCLYAKISDTPLDDGFDLNKFHFDLKGSNDQAQKNIIIVKNDGLDKDYSVLVRNIVNSSASYSLEIKPCYETDSEIFDLSNVSMKLSKILSEAWENGGSELENIELSADSNDPSIKTFHFISSSGKISNIILKPNECDVVQIKFNFKQRLNKKKIYYLDLIQKDSIGNIIGGERFQIETPNFSGIPVDPIIDVDPVPINNNQYNLSVNNKNYSSYKWTNEQGKLLGDNNQVSVFPSILNKEYFVTVTDENGDLASNNVDFNNLIGFDFISNKDNIVNINFKSIPSNNSTIEFISILDGESKLIYPIIEQSKSQLIDVYSLQAGFYLINYIVGDNLIDQKRIQISK